MAQAVFDGFNAHDVAALREVWADDVREHFPDGTVSGPEALADYLQALFDRAPDIHQDIITMAESGEHVFVHWQMSTGDIEVEGIEKLTVRDGKLVDNVVVFDPRPLIA